MNQVLKVILQLVQTKMAKVETGYEVRVPLFVNEGDVLRIDTRTGNYIERA